ncbi:MAG: helical backbone metal receptor [bacterium]|nr:helical backbone metal receptor [bacterium]
MKKILIAIIFLFLSFANSAKADEVTYVSLIPQITQIIYALGGEDNLIGISTGCRVPSTAAAEKPKLGNAFYIDTERVSILKPTYIFTVPKSKKHFSNTYAGAKMIYLSFDSIQDVYDSTLTLGTLIDKEAKAKELVADLKIKVDSFKTSEPKKILYLVQTDPYITIGKTSYVTEIIEKSGNSSLTSNILQEHPILKKEDLPKYDPDIVILSWPTDFRLLKVVYPNAKIIVLTPQKRNLIVYPDLRIWQIIKYFSMLK